jgi:hypothetical protein
MRVPLGVDYLIFFDFLRFFCTGDECPRCRVPLRWSCGSVDVVLVAGSGTGVLWSSFVLEGGSFGDVPFPPWPPISARGNSALC